MNREIGQLLSEMLRDTRTLYGPRLKGLYLFGSHARGSADAESDVDVLIVLDEVPSYGAEVTRTSELIGRLALHYGLAISRVFVSESEWRVGTSSFLANVREEAVAA